MAGELVCPSCHASHGPDERFCRDCGMPLVHPGTRTLEVVPERHARARKVSPQYGEGRLVKVGWARNQAEAELIAGLLLEEGVPAVIRRSGGFDVPDFLAARPRDVPVAPSGEEIARDVLRQVQPPAPDSTLEARPEWVRVLAVTVVIVLFFLSLAGVVAVLVR